METILQQPNQKTSAKDFFLHLASQVALYAVVINLVNLLFKVINTAYPQVNSGYYYYSSSFGISFPVSLIIIVFPIFILLNYFIEKEFVLNPISKHNLVRKWLVYFTIFVSGLIVVGDLVSVLYYFLDGQELTLGFLLKVLVLLVVSGLVFLYYLNDIREKVSLKTKKISAGLSLLVILVSIILAFSVIGSPRTQRLLKYDDTKLNDLMNLSNQISNYYGQNKKLPNNIGDLNQNYYTAPVDAQNGKNYEYKKMGDIDYKLCADFNFNFDDKKIKNYYTNKTISSYGMLDSKAFSEPYTYNRNYWQYKSGNYCFDLKIPEYVINQPVPIISY